MEEQKSSKLKRQLAACVNALQQIAASDPGPAYHIAKGVLKEIGNVD